MVARAIFTVPCFSNSVRSFSRRSSLYQCSYHSYEHKPAQVYDSTESDILKAAMQHVPDLGFSIAAIKQGALDTGHLEITHNLFPIGAFELIRYHLITERLKLQQSLGGMKTIQGVGPKIRYLCHHRLKANIPYVNHYQDALAIMALPSNIKSSLAELHNLSDEMWHLVDDQSADMSWYTKRLSLSTVYSTTEMYMTQDRSTNFEHTWAFLDRRLNDVYTVGSAFQETSQFVGFQLRQALNILASKGIKF